MLAYIRHMLFDITGIMPFISLFFNYYIMRNLPSH